MAWVPDISRIEGPIYQAIATSIANAIKDGSLAPGERLPSQRAMAQALDVDLTTVTRALALAQRTGIIESEGRRGSFVRHGGVATGQPIPDPREESGGMNMPPEPQDGTLRAAMRDGLAALLGGNGFAPLHYQPSGGTEADRVTAAALLSRIAGPTTAEETVITAGGQNALQAICAIELRRGTGIAAARLTYPGFLSLARHTGADIMPLAIDGEGILPDALETAARTGNVKAVYVVPTNDNPTTATIGLDRRHAIAGIAERYRLTVIEDDAYGQLRRHPLPPISTLIPTRSWYIASISKVLTPGLRVAFVRAPSIAGAMRLAAGIHESAVMAPPLSVALVTGWLRDGSYGRIIDSVRIEAIARQRIAADMLGGRPYAADPEGYHLWLSLADRRRGPDLASRCVAMRLPAVPDAAFAVEQDSGGDVGALRVSLGGARSRNQLIRDLRKLDALLNEARRDHIMV